MSKRTKKHNDHLIVVKAGGGWYVVCGTRVDNRIIHGPYVRRIEAALSIASMRERY
jgi:hypothetical protein